MGSISEKTITSYTVHAGDGDYGTVALELGEHSVTVMAESSFGTYGYHWSNTGSDPIGFLQRIRIDYAMGKFRGEEYNVFDRAAQEKELKTRILQDRRQDTIDAEHAREMFDQISEVCEAYTVNEFKSNMYYSGALIRHIYDNDCSEVDAATRPDPQCVGFWESIWRPLMAHLQ